MGPRWVPPYLAKAGSRGQSTQGLFRPNPPSPQRRAHLELVSSSSDDLQSTSAQGARGSPDPPFSYGEQWAGGETRKRCFPEQTRIGAELGFPRRVSLLRMQLPEASFVPFLRWALVVPSIAGGMWCAGASAHKDFSGTIHLLHVVEHVWSCFPALAMTCKAPVPREQEAARPFLALGQAET